MKVLSLICREMNVTSIVITMYIVISMLGGVCYTYFSFIMTKMIVVYELLVKVCCSVANVTTNCGTVPLYILCSNYSRPSLMRS